MKFVIVLDVKTNPLKIPFRELSSDIVLGVRDYLKGQHVEAEITVEEK